MSANTQPQFVRALRPAQSAVIARLQHGFAAHLQSEPLTVTRWLMYGQARLYVKTQQGTPIGWVDVRTGERMIEVPELQGAFEAAIAAVQPGIPPAYTPRRALLESVVSTRQPKGDGPAPRRAVVELDHAIWTPVTRPAVARRRSPRSARTPASHPTPVMPKSVPTRSSEPAAVHPGQLQFSRLDALADRVRLWRGTSERELVHEQLTSISRAGMPWTCLRANELGTDDAASDFLVGGPGGIFAVDVLTPQMVTIPGPAFVRRTSEVLTRAMESSVWVRHLMVPIGFSKSQLGALPELLPLVSRRRLPEFLAGQSQLLSPDEVELALGYARLRWTWRD